MTYLMRRIKNSSFQKASDKIFKFPFWYRSYHIFGAIFLLMIAFGLFAESFSSFENNKKFTLLIFALFFVYYSVKNYQIYKKSNYTIILNEEGLLYIFKSVKEIFIPWEDVSGITDPNNNLELEIYYGKRRPVSISYHVKNFDALRLLIREKGQFFKRKSSLGFDFVISNSANKLKVYLAFIFILGSFWFVNDYESPKETSDFIIAILIVAGLILLLALLELFSINRILVDDAGVRLRSVLKEKNIPFKSIVKIEMNSYVHGNQILIKCSRFEVWRLFQIKTTGILLYHSLVTPWQKTRQIEDS